MAKIERSIFFLVAVSAVMLFIPKSYGQEVSLEEAVAKYFPLKQINPQKNKAQKNVSQKKSPQQSNPKKSPQQSITKNSPQQNLQQEQSTLLENSTLLGKSNQQTVSASEPSSSELSKELQQLKSQVLQLNRELFILEEDLLFPASTQVAIFVSLDIGRFFKLDSVEVKINEQDVAGFLYTDRQRIALEQGGIQKLYLGNLKVGSHQLTAIFVGLDKDGRSVKRAINHSFNKMEDSVMIELKLVDNTLNYRTQVEVEEWVL